MASVERRRRNGKTTWVVRWRDPGRSQRKKTFSRKADAERYRTSVEHSRLAGTYIDPALARVTVGEWSSVWLRQVAVKPSTEARYESIVRTHILPGWRSVPLHAVTHGDVAGWVSELSDRGLAASTVRQVHRVLSLMLSLAVRDNRIAKNPADGVRLPRATPKTKTFLTHSQVALLAGAAGPENGLAVRVLAYTGLRFGELAAARVRSLDLARGRIEVAQSVTEVRGRAVFGPPKTHASRSVPLPPSLVGALAAHVESRDADEFLFPAPRGGVLLLRNWRRVVFGPAARAAGLDGVTPHDLRHTAASLAVSAGANVKAVQRMLGHASAAMTLDVYSGLFEDDLDEVARRLDLAASQSERPRGKPENT